MEKNKITLITPPDFFENDSFSILFINLGEEDQDLVSSWLANNPIAEHLNIYFYTNETDIPWLLFAISRSNYRFINLNSLNNNVNLLSSYILGKTNTFYKCDDENSVAAYSFINQQRVTNIKNFLEKILNDKTKTRM